MGIRASLLWIIAACALSLSCGDSSSDAGSGGPGAGTSSAAGRNSGGQGGDTSTGHGGSNQSGSANPGGAAHGGSAASAGTGPGAAGDAGANQGGASEGGAAGEDGAAGQLEGPARFEPWALWPMPNAASAGLPNPASYDTSTAGVVLDKITGLVWQASVSPSAYTWNGAKAYCASLVLAGFSDFRMPSRIELISIVDYTIAKPGPVIDAVAFPNTPNTLFWTASPVALYGTTRAWYVEFDNGFAFTESTNAEYNVRCVR